MLFILLYKYSGDISYMSSVVLNAEKSKDNVRG